MKKGLIIIAFLLSFLPEAFASNPEKARWIWYPGDMEVWLHAQVANRRQERGEFYPPFWRMDSPYRLVRFEKSVELKEPETICIFAEGRFQFRVNGEIIHDYDHRNIHLPAGKINLSVLVDNPSAFPSLFIQGKTVCTDDSWRVTNQNNQFCPVASGNFTDPAQPPSSFHLEYRPVTSVVLERQPNAMLVDFGRETFGKVIAEGVKGKGQLRLFYGETKQEAQAKTLAETYDYRKINSATPGNDTTAARAFRYIYAEWDPAVSLGHVSALYEYLPLNDRGSFSCSDTLLNRIYEVSLYTLHLNTREFHLDGIKRDRWVWSGDAYQSYLMNFYTFFDQDVNKRTFYALRGHDPVETHINTILDYSFYWMIGLYDHFLYTGDTAFIRQIYPKTKSLMKFCLDRTNANGLVEGLPGDWVFIDWADMDKGGEISFQQLLLARSLEALAMSARLAGDEVYANDCRQRSEKIREMINAVFWNDQKHAFVHNRKNEVLSETVTRYANMFAVLFGYASDAQKQQIREHVLLNDQIQKITTPYMKFYELASLCEIGEQEKALHFVRDYWGGMLKLGATSIWEAYDPEQTGDQHYAMYGRPFGKSLCHAWGANPVYLFGKYLLGVKPTEAGYRSYVIEPTLAGLEWIEGKVPTPKGDISVYMNKKEIRIKAVPGGCTLRIKSRKTPRVAPGLEVTQKGNGVYDIRLAQTTDEQLIRYWPE